MNETINNPAVVNEVNNISNNNSNMNNVIDFSSVCGEDTVAQTATVDKQVVSDLFKAFMVIPREVLVKFKHVDGYLRMVVLMNHRDKFFRRYETYADAKLVESMIGAMSGRPGCLEGYLAEEHSLEASESDPRIDIFRQFINSPLRCHFEADFVAGNGDRYVCATFNISYKKQIKFCLKRTNETETIVDEAIKADIQVA